MNIIPTSDDGTYKFKTSLNELNVVITEKDYDPLRESIKVDTINLTRNLFLVPQRDRPPVNVESAPLPTTININGQVLKKGEIIVLNSIQFEQSKSDLLVAGKNELNNVVQLMKKYPTLIIELSGNTSNEDNYESKNLKLSEERVAACKDYISTQVSNVSNRVKMVGYGSSKPRVPNNSDKNRKINRRVELKVLSF